MRVLCSVNRLPLGMLLLISTSYRRKLLRGDITKVDLLSSSSTEGATYVNPCETECRERTSTHTHTRMHAQHSNLKACTMNACVALRLSSVSTGESTGGRVVNRDSKLLVSSTPLCVMWYVRVYVCARMDRCNGEDNRSWQIHRTD